MRPFLCGRRSNTLPVDSATVFNAVTTRLFCLVKRIIGTSHEVFGRLCIVGKSADSAGDGRDVFLVGERAQQMSRLPTDLFGTLVCCLRRCPG